MKACAILRYFDRFRCHILRFEVSFYYSFGGCACMLANQVIPQSFFVMHTLLLTSSTCMYIKTNAAYVMWMSRSTIYLRVEQSNSSPSCRCFCSYHDRHGQCHRWFSFFSYFAVSVVYLSLLHILLCAFLGLSLVCSSRALSSSDNSLGGLWKRTGVPG